MFYLLQNCSTVAYGRGVLTRPTKRAEIPTWREMCFIINIIISFCHSNFTDSFYLYSLIIQAIYVSLSNQVAVKRGVEQL